MPTATLPRSAAHASMVAASLALATCSLTLPV